MLSYLQCVLVIFNCMYVISYICKYSPFFILDFCVFVSLFLFCFFVQSCYLLFFVFVVLIYCDDGNFF
jgi:hypothetical protein